MHLFNIKNEPIFLKVDSHASNQLEKLKTLNGTLNREGQALLERNIKRLEYGIVGEKNIAFELKNSHTYMVVLQDIYLEFGDLSAQIDYLVFTRKHCYVIECKNLYGNITITERGDFIRTSEFRGKKQKEGIYSPLTQNQRHIDLIQKIVVDQKKNFFMKFAAKKFFGDYYKPVVVLANPKTILDTKHAKPEISKRVIRADQLINYIIEIDKQSKEIPYSKKEVQTQAESFLKLHKNMEKDYTKKYTPYIMDATPIFKTDLYNELKAYRLTVSQKENIKAYYIFNNKQLEALIAHMPQTIEQLYEVKGFGKVKINKYGASILEILSKYSPH